MSSESGLTCDLIREYLLQHNGRVRNRELVTHFKPYLTGTSAQEEARVKFKEFINYLATTKKEDNEKYVILRKKFFPINAQDTLSLSSLSSLSESTPLSESAPLSESGSLSPRAPPPYRPPPPVTSPTPSTDSLSRDEFSLDNISQCSLSSDAVFRNNVTDTPPQAPPRRRTLEKHKFENKENICTEKNETNAPSEASEKEPTDSEIVSVKERMQKFNRMAETDMKTSSSQSNLRKRHEKGADDDDGVSVTSMDTKTRDWIIRSSMSDYQMLAKLAAENPRLVQFKTALHWAAKHGNEDIIKLIAGTHGADVNIRTNGGYTPLHLAAQFGHENVYDLLVKVYKADHNIRDWSGKKAYSYLQTTNKSVSAETFRKIKARRKQSEKDLGFLRIGSLNVRVKKTTEAFSNFLGYGGSGPNNNGEKIHKSWGSADNLPQKIMPPPKSTQIKKRKSKRAQDFQAISHSTPSTPNQIRAHNKQPDSRGDSDSDTACGFDNNWQTKLE